MFGTPNTFIFDAAITFKGSLIQELTARLGCSVKYSTPHHHQSLAIIERSHAQIAMILAMYIGEKHNNWSKFVKLIQFAINSVPNESTQMSPYYLAFGQQARLPIDINFNLPFQHKSNLDWFENLQKVRDICREKLNALRVRMKTRYDKNRVSADYKIGSKVLIYYPQNIKGLTDKFLKKHKGPFTVMKKLSELNYECERRINGKTQNTVIHVSRMKPFITRPSYLVAPKRRIKGPRNKLYFMDY